MRNATRQFATFALIGIVNTAVQFVVFELLLRVVGLPILVSSAIGYAFGVANSYVMNRLWTFRVSTPANVREFGIFAAVNGVSMGLNLAALHTLVSVIGFSPEAGQIGAIAVSVAANFLGSKFLAFRSLAPGAAKP